MEKKHKKFHILVIHGPNLNLLGEREPEIYGKMTLKELEQEIKTYCKGKPVKLKYLQSNHEGQLIDWIHQYRHWAHGMIINPGALTHYSYALRDAIAGVSVPTVEVHISDISKREPFRQISVIQPVCIAQISGKGKQGYFEAVDVLLAAKKDNESKVCRES